MPPIVRSQTVAVTGTITDTQTTPYSNGLLTVTFVNATGQLATFGGNPSFQKSYAIYLDANGAFTISLPPNSTASPSIQPAGTQWNFSYQSQGGYGAANINVTITGAGSISGTLSNLARITWPYGNIPPPGGSGQGIVFVSSTTLGWGATSALPTGVTSPGPGSLTGTGNFLATNLPPALPTTPNGVSFIDTSTPAGGVGAAPAWSWPGVPGRSNAGATDAIVATDRGAGIIETNGGAVAVSLPQAGSTNFGNNFDFFIKCATTTVCTITPTVSQIAGNNGTLGATLVMPASSTTYCYSFDNANYQCGVVSTGTGTVTTTGSPASSNCAYFSGATSIIGTANCTLDASGNFTIAGSLQTFSFAGTTIFDFTGANSGGQFRSSANNGAFTFLQNTGANNDFFNIKSKTVGGGTRQLFLADPNNTVLWSISAGKVDAYNQLQTVGQGVAPILAVIHSTGLTGAVSTATLCGSGATACGNAGQYHIHWNFIQTGTACTTNTTGGVTFLLTWTDTNATVHTASSLSMDDSLSLVGTSATFHFNQTGNGLGTVYATGDTNISTNGAIIQYATGFSQCSVAGTATYQLDAAVTRLQ